MKNRLCKQQSSVAYNSCIDSYYKSKDRNDIYEYWLYLQEAKRFCEANGVMKALEIIEIIEDVIDLDTLNGKNGTQKNNNGL